MAELILRIGTENVRAQHKALEDNERVNRIVNLLAQSIGEERAIDLETLSRNEKRQLVADWIAEIMVDTARMQRRQNIINEATNSTLINGEL